MPNEMKIADSGDRTQFDTGAVRDMHEGKGRCDLLPMCVLLRLARHYENGSRKYGDRNWEKGIPCHSFADSALRHLFKYMDGQTDEDHLIAAIWNLCGLAWTEEKHPELIDIPARMKTSESLLHKRNQGHWNKFSMGCDAEYVCSNCNFTIVEADPEEKCEYNYCPICGSKMKLEE